MSRQPPAGRELTGAFRAVIEVFLVALAASYLVGMGFQLQSIDGTRILGSTRLTFLFLASEGTVTLLLIALLIRGRGQSFRDLGWVWRGRGREFLVGLCCVPFLFATNLLVSGFFRLFLPALVSTSNPLLNSIGDRQELILLLLSSVLVGGIKEELQRAFVLQRFEHDLGRLLEGWIRGGGAGSRSGGQRLGLVLGLALWSCFFALGHVAQGVDGAVGAGLLGLWFGILYAWRRNLVAVVVAHSLFDVITLTIFWNLGRSG